MVTERDETERVDPFGQDRLPQRPERRIGGHVRHQDRSGIPGERERHALNRMTPSSSKSRRLARSAWVAAITASTAGS
jgi:hypothetical protein